MKSVASLAAAAALASLALAAPPETAAQKAARMKWWKEARFGMFIHWGLYSVPAGKYGDKTGYGEWIMESAHVPVAEYESYMQRFNPTKFNADSWAKMAKDAGMRYVTITTKHHDGFALFDSKVSDYDIMATPFKRDIMKELSTAVRKQGLTMCWYHSIMDWHHPDYTPHRAWSTTPPPDANFERYEKYLHGEVTELLKNYGKIGVMWFDGEWESTWNHERGQKLYDLCRKLQPSVIVNNRVDVGRGGMGGMSDNGFAGDYGTPEQTIPATGLPGIDWESCMTMNDNWGYNAVDKHFKSTKTLITNLVDIVSKGGNYLLNVGPRSDGTFPPESVELLKGIGKWMHVNSESIYGTDASPFKKLAYGRATQKAEGSRTHIYLQVFDWPKDGKLVVPGVGNDGATANLLGGGKLKVTRQGGDLVVSVPTTAPNDICSVVRLTVKGKPIVYEAPEITADSDILVDSLPVRVVAPSAGLQVRFTTDGSTPNASSPIYNGPITVKKTTTVTVRSFFKGKPVSGSVARTFRQVTPWQAPNSSLQLVKGGLTRKVYRGSFSTCPDWTTLTIEAAAAPMQIGLGEFSKAENFGLTFSGYIMVPKPGVYVFSLLSDDGSKLVIDGKTVIDNDGLHAPEDKQGAAPLGAGPHAITVQYFNQSGGSALGLKWGLAGSKLAPVAAESLWFPR